MNLTETVSCTVGNKEVDCTLNPGWDFSMCSDKTLKRLGVKINRSISSEDREMKFFREMSTKPIGWANIPLTFNSNKKNRSIITNTQVLVVKHHRNMDDEILLGSPWFMGRSLMKNEYDDELQIYDAKIIIDMPDCVIRRRLFIRSLKGRKNKFIHIPIDATYRDFNENSDSSSDSSSDSNSSSDLSSDT